MIDDMQIRNLTPNTQRVYVAQVVRFACHFRTAALGGHVERCCDCGHQRRAYNSCRNRNCPKCEGLARAQWLQDRQAELLDVPNTMWCSPCQTRSR
jgi:hypothetical protein